MGYCSIPKRWFALFRHFSLIICVRAHKYVKQVIQVKVNITRLRNPTCGKQTSSPFCKRGLVVEPSVSVDLEPPIHSPRSKSAWTPGAGPHGNNFSPATRARLQHSPLGHAYTSYSFSSHSRFSCCYCVFTLPSFLFCYGQSPPPSPTTTLARATSPLHVGRDPPTTPPPPPPSETDPYYNAFSRHYSFSVKHNQTRNKITGSVTPSTSPKKVAPPRVCSRSTSFSVSSTSSHSSMSSLGSSIGSPSIESFPRPPTPLLSPGYSIDLQCEPLPPPPFPGAVSALPHAGN